MDRRKFLKSAGLAAVGSVVAGVGSTHSWRPSGAGWCGGRSPCRTCRSPFRGMTVALLADVHHGPFVPLAYVRHVVAMTNALKPDIIALAGDYVHRHQSYIAPGIEELGKLKAILGGSRFGATTTTEITTASRISSPVLGPRLRRRSSPILTTRGSGSNEVAPGCGSAASATSGPTIKTCVPPWATPPRAMPRSFSSHNPDFVETIRDRRVGLVLSGHTHGGQIIVPGFGAPIVPSRYGQKYLHGLVQGPCCQVFVTRGAGTITPPVRFLCRPEVVLITLCEISAVLQERSPRTRR